MVVVQVECMEGEGGSVARLLATRAMGAARTAEGLQAAEITVAGTRVWARWEAAAAGAVVMAVEV